MYVQVILLLITVYSACTCIQAHV